MQGVVLTVGLVLSLHMMFRYQFAGHGVPIRKDASRRIGVLHLAQVCTTWRFQVGFCFALVTAAPVGATLVDFSHRMNFKNENSVAGVPLTPAPAAAGMLSHRNVRPWISFELAARQGSAHLWTRMSLPAEQQPIVGSRCNRRLLLNAGLSCNWRAAGNDKTTPHICSVPARTPLHFTLNGFRRRSAVSTTSSAVVAVLLLVLSIMLQNHTAVATVSAGERSALVDLWNGVSGMPAACTDWNTGDPCANGWSGVSCSAAPAVTYVEVLTPVLAVVHSVVVSTQARDGTAVSYPWGWSLPVLCETGA